MSRRTTIGLPYTFSKWPDPRRILTSGDWVASAHHWAALVYLSESGRIQPGIAERWTVGAGGTEISFDLKDNLKWSDGSSMTAAEILASLEISAKGTSHSGLKRVIRKIEASPSKIIFHLSRPVPALLIMLTYPDWAITHPTSDHIASGPYIIQPTDVTGVRETIPAKRNAFAANLGFSQPLENAQFRVFKDCKELVKAADELISFRSYVEAWSEDCETKLKNLGFIVDLGPLTWSTRAVFTQRGIQDISKVERSWILGKTQQYLSKSGVLSRFAVRSLGLRPPGSFGTLNPDSFNSILGSFQNLDDKDRPKRKLKLVAQASWVDWEGFRLFRNALTASGVDFEQIVLESNEMVKSYGNGALHRDYDVILDPLGVGDPDPDGSWQIASKYSLAGQIKEQELDKAFFEMDTEQRAKIYQNLERRMLTDAIHIPLVFTGQIVGLHKSFRPVGLSPLYHGLVIYDLVSVKD